MASEFDLIAKYFTRPTRHAELGVGDDAALVSAAQGMELAIAVDMLVAGTHFFHDTDAYNLGWKSLAVNVSDMAAMGANSRWATLAIALPEVNEAWLAEFSRGFFACADKFNVDLIGGDTTRGPLTISVQITGEVPAGKALRRSGAKPGDDIWISGSLGSAAMGLAHLQGNTKIAQHELPAFLSALEKPMPRTTLGMALRDVANSCIDVSDGLLADLGHILKASHLGAKLDMDKMPCHDVLRRQLDDPGFQQYLLAGGDDYELLFTVPKSQRAAISQLSQQLDLPLSLIGETTEQPGLEVTYKNQKLVISKRGFDHFG